MRPLHHRDTFQLSTYKLSVNLCGVTYYACEDGSFNQDESLAFTDFVHRAVKAIESNLKKDGQIEVTITETTDS